MSTRRAPRPAGQPTPHRTTSPHPRADANSRPGRRRWCSMQLCGARSQMRAYRAKRRVT
ncbi:CGNR zinc finger domain-containing protein [Streptomyces johnsoniae]|uniref:CGNR zinc finger domain-containing protein n=1 Tax=Streptomyces johnsoniae TaxID=3075532 RepID=A0ABU2RYX1_9ACTN|nr:CGNR zinc finger domain-containing protein [Streptomyces sp. DSM 41886]MDT0441616.1 CGNR zinc finger domain-containing protein [Streptomyces sp. DSM 41886]